MEALSETFDAFLDIPTIMGDIALGGMQHAFLLPSVVGHMVASHAKISGTQKYGRITCLSSSSRGGNTGTKEVSSRKNLYWAPKRSPGYLAGLRDAAEMCENSGFQSWASIVLLI